MAISVSAIMSKGRGKVGSVTVRRLNGRTVISENAISVSNPQTYEQMLNRTVLAAAGWFAGLNLAYFRSRGYEQFRTVGKSRRGSTLLPRQEYVRSLVSQLRASDTAMTLFSQSTTAGHLGDYQAIIQGGEIDGALNRANITGLSNSGIDGRVGQVLYGNGNVSAVVQASVEATVEMYVYVLAQNSDKTYSAYTATGNVSVSTIQDEVTVPLGVTLPADVARVTIVELRFPNAPIGASYIDYPKGS